MSYFTRIAFRLNRDLSVLAVMKYTPDGIPSVDQLDVCSPDDFTSFCNSATFLPNILYTVISTGDCFGNVYVIVTDGLAGLG